MRNLQNNVFIGVIYLVNIAFLISASNKTSSLVKRESMDFIVFFAFLPFKEISETVPNANTLSLTFALHAENNDADTAIVIISTIILNTFLVLFINPAFSLINSIKLYHIKQQITTKSRCLKQRAIFVFNT